MEDDFDAKIKQILDAKLKLMQQDHDLDVEKLRWEQEKFKLQQKAEKEKWESIKEMFSPVFALQEVKDATKKIGEENK